MIYNSTVNMIYGCNTGFTAVKQGLQSKILSSLYKHSNFWQNSIYHGKAYFMMM